MISPAATRNWMVVEQIMAGDVPRRALTAGETSQIMTGAPLPPGADAVVMWEHVRVENAATVGGPSSRVRIAGPIVRPGQNVMPRAASFARGQILLRAGHELRPIELGLLAEVGRGEVERDSAAGGCRAGDGQ